MTSSESADSTVTSEDLQPLRDGEYPSLPHWRSIPRGSFAHTLKTLFSTKTTATILVLGLSIRTFLFAFLITMFLFLCANTWLVGDISSAFDRAVVPELASLDADKAALRCVNDLKWASPDERSWIASGLRAAESEQVHHQIEAMLAQVGSDESGQQSDTLKTITCGNQSGLRFALLHAESTTGQRIFVALKTNLSQTLQDEWDAEKNQGKQKVVTHFCDALADQVHPTIRNLQRINGPIQWITVFLSSLVVCLLIQRWGVLNRIRSSARAHRSGGTEAVFQTELNEVVDHVRLARQSGASEFEQTRVAQEEMNSLREGVENGVYSTLGFFVSMLPSLGFIGTVWGMGTALLKADQLMTSTDRQQAIQMMTRQLGYAFDTTLVALSMSLLVGILLAAVRVKERTLLREYERLLKLRITKPRSTANGN